MLKVGLLIKCVKGEVFVEFVLCNERLEAKFETEYGFWVGFRSSLTGWEIMSTMHMRPRLKCWSLC